MKEDKTTVLPGQTSLFDQQAKDKLSLIRMLANDVEKVRCKALFAVDEANRDMLELSPGETLGSLELARRLSVLVESWKSFCRSNSYSPNGGCFIGWQSPKRGRYEKTVRNAAGEDNLHG